MKLHYSDEERKMTAASKIALVTGGSRGLGRNMALRLAQAGKDVILTCVSKKELALEVAAEIEKLGQKAAVLPLDVGNIPQLNAFIASQTALGRVGQADDIGSIVAFLASEDSHWITGQRIEASGGCFCSSADEKS